MIVGVAVLAATASQYAQGICDGKNWMRQFMGIFLVIFAMFKLFDLPGFADGFQKYDLIAKRYRRMRWSTRSSNWHSVLRTSPTSIPSPRTSRWSLL